MISSFMDKVRWGIIGCGDVAEKKSGPAFNKVRNSELLAVMRRNGQKARDFAARHQVPQWYDNLEELLNNEDINAVYIATPPSTHKDLTLKALAAKKNVYLEKPMAMNAKEAREICEKVKESGCKLSVAHYKRMLPAFQKVGEILGSGVLGEIRFADIQLLQPQHSDIVASTEENWRVKPAISGGGLFHDLAPHQIDLMLTYFGLHTSALGFSRNLGKAYEADDIVNGIISFENGIQFRGIWAFDVPEKYKRDNCTIIGSKGSLSFSFFGDKLTLDSENTNEVFNFEPISHIQQPMIKAVVEYFLGEGTNPCTAEEGLTTTEIMDSFSR